MNKCEEVKIKFLFASEVKSGLVKLCVLQVDWKGGE